MIGRALSILLAFATPALADDLGVPEKAKALAEQGRVLHDAGDYGGAIAVYREAYVLAPRPGLLFNLAQAYRLSGDCDDASFMYQRYLETNPDEAGREVAQQNLEIVEKCGHGGLKIAAPIRSTPVITQVRAPDPPAMPRDRAQAHVGELIVAAGIGTLTVAGAFAYDAHQASDRVSAAYATGTVTPNLSQEDSRGQRSALIASTAGVLGGAAVVTGAIVYALGRYSKEVRRIAVAPRVRGGQVTVSWAF
jgi:tetratricopeptide (TPR) repeat protein